MYSHVDCGEVPAELKQDMDFAEGRARTLVAEKFFWDAAQPFHHVGFSVTKRNPHHWDIFADQVPGKIKAELIANPGNQTSADPNAGQRERAFRIRGGPGDVRVFDERWNPHRQHPREILTFRTIQAAMLFITDEFMQEPANG